MVETVFEVDFTFEEILERHFSFSKVSRWVIHKDLLPSQSFFKVVHKAFFLAVFPQFSFQTQMKSGLWD